MKLLDTNVFVYAIGRPHRFKEPCVRILRDVAGGVGQFNIDTELLQEILYLYSARGQRELGLSTCGDLFQVFPSPFPITLSEVVLAHELLTRHPRLLPRYAIHAAVAMANRLEAIVSADRVFDEIEGLRRLDPLALYR